MLSLDLDGLNANVSGHTTCNGALLKLIQSSVVTKGLFGADLEPLSNNYFSSNFSNSI